MGPLGIKLNRGRDGYIRVLSHKKKDYVLGDRPVAVGDLVQEAAGVDLSQPITNKMWGNTMEIIKRSRRPMFFVVGEELLAWPPGVLTTFQQKGAVFPEAGGEAVAVGGPVATGGNSGDEPPPGGYDGGGSLFLLQLSSTYGFEWCIYVCVYLLVYPRYNNETYVAINI